MVAIKSVNRNRDNGMLTTRTRAACVRKRWCLRQGCLLTATVWVRTRCLRLRGLAKAPPAARPGVRAPVNPEATETAFRPWITRRPLA
jgi:hypothetical protein